MENKINKKQKEKKKLLQVIACWQFSGLILQHFSRPFTTLTQPPLPACAGPREQPEVKA